MRSGSRTWRIEEAPPEHGWYRFAIDGSRRARVLEPAWPDAEAFSARDRVEGYLLGDRFIADGATVTLDPRRVFEQSAPVHLVEPGLERFARAALLRLPDGRLVYLHQTFPLGPEGEVLAAYQDRREGLAGIAGVTPSLHLAFLWLSMQRQHQEARRRQLEREAAREEARRAREAAQAAARDRLQRVVEGGARRARLAAGELRAAATAALAVSGAELLDLRPAPRRDERVVTFRFQQRRFECLIHAATLRIIDAGICLQDHATGERGDRRFTLESLPAVIDEALRTHRLVVWGVR